MTETTTGTTPSAPGPTPRSQSLRFWGALILVMFFLTSAVGGSLALESSYLAVTLASHIGLAVVTLALCGYASAVVSRPYRSRTRVFVRITGTCAGVATVAGIVFLLFGGSNYALAAMSGFAVLGIVVSILVIVFGGPSERVAAPSTPA